MINSNYAITIKTICFFTACFLLQACNASFHDLGAPPQITPIGYEAPIQDILVAPDPEIISSPDRLQMTDNSILEPTKVSFFQDTRAYKVGDILTVDIEINDSARLNNSSGRETSVDGSLGASTDITLGNLGTIPPLDINGALASDLTVDRAGTVDRTEKINLQIAAAVVSSAANGNLHIVGSQEVRVNHELRILTVQGVVRAKDITPDNTIPYEKIAEARITYGGHNSRYKPRKRKFWNIFKKPEVQPIGL